MTSQDMTDMWADVGSNVGAQLGPISTSSNNSDDSSGSEGEVSSGGSQVETKGGSSKKAKLDEVVGSGSVVTPVATTSSNEGQGATGATTLPFRVEGTHMCVGVVNSKLRECPMKEMQEGLIWDDQGPVGYISKWGRQSLNCVVISPGVWLVSGVEGSPPRWIVIAGWLSGGGKHVVLPWGRVLGGLPQLIDGLDSGVEAWLKSHNE